MVPGVDIYQLAFNQARVGAAWGARSRKSFRRAVRLTSELAIGTALATINSLSQIGFFERKAIATQIAKNSINIRMPLHA